MSKEPCTNCGQTSCNGIDCYYKDDEQDDTYSCPVCKRDCCQHFTETLTELTQAQARIKELEALVREMALAIDSIKSFELCTCPSESNDCSIRMAAKILSRPKVQAIMNNGRS